ncbi:24581_t:CDS:10 [Cetraspora pellucida]|uniref:24581_t:CDS:1 n=1 Tax=Cetraspora pellucida TaxID=1433469 RepID=A0A9N9B1B4_9GLOM|nr:24581_t:CDS:10 [Cetraspora pellucida]
MSLIDDFIEQSNEVLAPSNVSNLFLEASGFEPADPVHMLETGFVSAGLADDDSGIFTLDRVQFQPPAPMVAMAVSNEVLVMALESNHILRIDLQQAHNVEVKIYKVFFDPTGRHLLITTEQGENFYIFEKWKKAKVLSKFKGIIIESVGWNKTVGTSDTSTKKILIGSRNGIIYEAEIESTDEYFKRGGGEKYIKQVYSLNDNQPITGLRVEEFPAILRKYFILATTPTRIYQFIGHANPGADIDAPGIYHGSLVFGSQDHVVDSAKLLPYPSMPSENDPSTMITENPLSIALTEFHFILLYKERIRAICQLNDQIVYEEIIPLKVGEVVKSMAIDSVKNTFWIYTDCTIFELIVAKEDRDVWKLYLEKQQFDTALQYCKNPAQRDEVLTTQADYYFSQGRFLLSATYYAQSTVHFEEVALKFVERDERDALRNYLLNKLEKLRRTDLTQKTMIATWLVEIYLSKINLLEDLTASGSSSDDTSNYKAEQKALEGEFQNFLEQFKAFIFIHDKRTTYNLIASHGRTEELLFYASLIGDYDKVISHWVQEKDYKQALDVLSRQASIDVYYKFAPILMENAPYETVNVWMRQPNLNPRNLMPALLKYDHSKTSEDVTQNQAIRYLHYVVSQLNNTDPAIHNFLLTLYATQPTSNNDESSLLKFLATEGKEPYYNMDYALRLCSQNGKTQSCVHIYSNMGLFEEAVDLALKHNDLELARINADKPEDDEALRKKLWLKIARHVVEKKQDIKMAMDYLQHCELLKIEDILPFFPDFVLIDNFKSEICAALEEYNTHIEDLKQEMEEATKSAESIRLDIRELRSRRNFVRFAIVTSGEKCSLCDFPLLTRQFYIFPCQHAFHSDCLIQEVTKHLNTVQLRKILELQEQIGKERAKELSNFNHPPDSTARGRNSFTPGGLDRLKGLILPDVATHSGDDVAVVVSKVDQLKDELDDLVASECVLCGDMMIKTIEKPFINEEESDLLVSWAI